MMEKSISIKNVSPSPFLMGDKISEECEQWECYLVLLDIIEIALSPKISKSTVSYLRVLIEEHHLKFIDLYPHLNVIPKMHYMVHYPSQILTLGPLVRSWTMQHEANLNLLSQDYEAISKMSHRQ